MFKSRKLSIVVLAVFFFSIFTGLGTPKASAAASPTDIAGNWASAQIISLINQGVISGYADGTFKPNNSISRAEFMTMINRAFNFTAQSNISYSDVKTSDWFYSEIAKARAAGYIAGYPDGTMKPNNNVTREEAAVILAGALGMGSSTSALTFSDAAQIQSWSRSAISAMVGAGYISGYPDGTYKPANSISRAEAAAMIFAGRNRVQVTGVSLNKSSTTIPVGDTETLSATITPSNASNKSVTWSTSNNTIATVTSTGLVTGIKEGTATITAIADHGYYASCIVTVGDIVKVTSVTLNKSTISLDVDDTYTLSATVKPSNATNKTLTWSSSDEDVATVSSSGKVTGQDEGTCTIKAKATDGSGEYDTCKVTVSDKNNELTLSDDDVDMDTNDEVTIKAYLPDDIDMSDVRYFYWESDDENVADIIDYDDDYDSYIKFTIGSYDEEDNCTITIYVKTDDGDEYSAECDVNVGEGSGGEITLSRDSIDMDVDDETTILAYLPEDITMSDVFDVRWESDDEDIADIEDYDEYSSYIKFYVDGYDDGDCTITITIETDDGDEYEADFDVTVGDGSGGGDLEISDSSIDMETDDVAYVKVYMPDDYETNDIDDIDWDIDGDDEIIDDIDYNDDYTSYVKFYIYSSDEEGDCTITFYIEIDGDDYEVDCDVYVED